MLLMYDTDYRLACQASWKSIRVIIITEYHQVEKQKKKIVHWTIYPYYTVQKKMWLIQKKSLRILTDNVL